MSTISINGGIYRTNTSIRVPLASFRATHRDNEDLTNKTIKLQRNDSIEFTSESFFYAKLVTNMDKVSITNGANTIELEDVKAGFLAFPFPCTVEFSVPLSSTNMSTRSAEVWFS